MLNKVGLREWNITYHCQAAIHLLPVDNYHCQGRGKSSHAQLLYDRVSVRCCSLEYKSGVRPRLDPSLRRSHAVKGLKLPKL